MTSQITGSPAQVGRGSMFSAIWLVPIVAILIGCWMIYTYWASQGPIIQLSFVSAEAIEAGKTKVRMKNVNVGEVLSLKLSEDAEHVILSVRIEKSEAHFLREDTKFWVVRPRVGVAGISGLETLVSGAYIELSPGSGEEVSLRAFKGLETPPATPVGTPGLHLTLDSNSDKALSQGDTILFHGMSVGTIEYVHFNTDERRTYYNAFIRAPYDALITSNTRFWFSSGVNLDLSADGVRLEVGSLQTLLAGGVSFDVPRGQPRGVLITERAFFSIFSRESAIYDKLYQYSLPYVLLFNDSIRGLQPGAPVEYRGIKVGQVKRTDIEYPQIVNLLDPNTPVPVTIELVPSLLGFADTAEALLNVKTELEVLIMSGLRGGLATGSLLSGSKYIELKYHESPPESLAQFGDYSVIPVIDGQLGQILTRVEETLDTINRLPLQAIAESTNKAINEAALTLKEIGKSATELDTILADPKSHELVGSLNLALNSFQRLAEDFSEGSATNQELQATLRSLETTLQELEPLLGVLRRRPNSLIFGDHIKQDIEPKGANQ
jgi:paraquat-inducible protein B